MTDLAIVPNQRAIKRPDQQRSKPLKVKGKLFDAIELIVFEGLPLDQAAQRVGLTTYTLRQAFGRAHVVSHLKARREVLRASACGKNIHRLCEIRDAADNMPAVNAIKVLEQLGDDETTGSTARQSLPGVVVQIINTVADRPDRDMQTLVNVSHEPNEDPL